MALGAYEDKAGRRAIRICDIFDDETLEHSIRNLIFYHNILRTGLGAKEVTQSEIKEEILQIREELGEFVKPSFEIAKELKNHKNIMFEGAQGALLDVNFGTYPFVTSSNTVSSQIGLGSCLGSDAIGETLGIVKAYTTRVLRPIPNRVR